MENSSDTTLAIEVNDHITRAVTVNEMLDSPGIEPYDVMSLFRWMRRHISKNPNLKDVRSSLDKNLSPDYS